MKLIVNAQQKILRRLRYKNIYVNGQKKALDLSKGYITKNALKSPQGIESSHRAHHSTHLDEFFRMIYRTCDHVVGRKKKCQTLYELTNV